MSLNIDQTIELVINTVTRDREKQRKLIDIVQLIVPIEMIDNKYFDDTGNANNSDHKVFRLLFRVHNINFVDIGVSLHERNIDIKYSQNYTDLILLQVHKLDVSKIEKILPSNTELVIQKGKALKQLKYICRNRRHLILL